LIKIIDQRGETINALGCVPVWLRPIMRFNFLDSFWIDGLRAVANLGQIGLGAYGRRKHDPEPRSDLLSHIFNAIDEETGRPLPEAEIIAESTSFIVGGSDTTSSTITNVLDFISRDETLQKRLTDEVDATFPGKMDDNWSPPNSSFTKMPYLNAVLREVLRVRPTSSTGLERITPSGGKVIAGVYIPEGVGANYETLSVD
jgi:benzoate 4-monooxygenase